MVLLIAAMPGRLEAAAALAVFAPMSIVSMALCTSAFAWVLTRPVIELLTALRGSADKLLGRAAHVRWEGSGAVIDRLRVDERVEGV